jgi:hypothetical protein
VTEDAVRTVLEILGAAALDEHLTSLPGRCTECGSHVETQRHTRDCPSYTVPDVWELHRVSSKAKVSWNAFRLPYDPQAQPYLWLARVFQGKRDKVAWDLQEALGTDICTGCGTHLGEDSLARMCQAMHWEYQDLPCARCHGVIDYVSKDRANTKRLIEARTVKPVRAKAMGWTLAQTNHRSNFRPEHRACG